MAHIDTIGVDLFSVVEYSTSALPSSPSYSNIDALTFTEIAHVAEIPAFGTPANIVNVPQYGQSISSQVQAQADAPTIALTLNYVPSVHNTIQDFVGNGTKYTFRIRLAPAELPDTISATTLVDDFAFEAQVASFEVTPSLSGARQATMTLALDGEIVGPFTSS